MSETDNPQHQPERADGAAPSDGAPAQPTPGQPTPIHFGPEPVRAAAAPASGNASPAPAPTAPATPVAAQPADGADQAAPAGEPAAPAVASPPAPVKPGAQDIAGRGVFAGARTAWLLVALLCGALGIVASVLGARSLANSDAAKTQRSTHQAASSIASSVNAGIQHEEDLTLTASGFFADHPTASTAEFHTWAKWVQASHRYPELAELRLVTPVAAAGLAAFEARTIPGAPKPATLTAAAATRVAPHPLLHIVPPGQRPVYCFAIAGLSRSGVHRLPPGTDYCVRTPGLLGLRDSGRSGYAGTAIAGVKALRIETPVYRGGVTPPTVAARRAAFVGWLQQVLVPGVVLGNALGGHPGAARLRFRSGAANIAFASGTAATGALTTASNLHNGWSLKSFLTLPPAGISGDGRAQALLIGGIVLSVLLGLLIALLGIARGRSAAPRPASGAKEDLYDPLTKLPNRGLTLDLSERMLARTLRMSGMLGGALIVDVDWFKDVNDKLGRAAGDQLLQTIAERLERVVRSGDTVGRLEGDKFVILCEAAARVVRLDSLARRVIEAVHEPVVLDDFGPSFFVTVSIGVAYGRYEHPDDLLRDAQIALDAAKTAGKDGYTLFNANMRSVIESQAVLEAELNAALQENQFFVLYQPICALGTRAITGFEALIRWQHPTQGILTPTDFLPAAEETGLIVPIGRWVLEEACARAAGWNVAGHRVGVSVMVSPRQLNRDGFATDVRRALQQSGIEPSLLTLEVGESTVMDDVETAITRLTEIKTLGVKIAIDDFGNAYARRSDLQRLPLDFVKVDPANLAASDDEDYRNWLLEAILILGRDLSLSVIAKGIETEEQMTRLKVMGCPLAQGYFMGEPTPVSSVEAVLRSRADAVAGAGNAESLQH